MTMLDTVARLDPGTLARYARAIGQDTAAHWRALAEHLLADAIIASASPAAIAPLAAPIPPPAPIAPHGLAAAPPEGNVVVGPWALISAPAAPIAAAPKPRRTSKRATIWPPPVIEVTFATGEALRLSTWSRLKDGPDIERAQRLARLFLAAELGRARPDHRYVWQRPPVPLASLPAITSACVVAQRDPTAA